MDRLIYTAASGLQGADGGAGRDRQQHGERVDDRLSRRPGRCSTGWCCKGYGVRQPRSRRRKKSSDFDRRAGTII